MARFSTRFSVDSAYVGKSSSSPRPNEEEDKHVPETTGDKHHRKTVASSKPSGHGDGRRKRGKSRVGGSILEKLPFVESSTVESPVHELDTESETRSPTLPNPGASLPLRHSLKVVRKGTVEISDEKIIRGLETHGKTKKLLLKHGFGVFRFMSDEFVAAKGDTTDSFIRHLEYNGTKEAAREVAVFLSWNDREEYSNNLDLQPDDLNLQNPLNLHLCNEGPPMRKLPKAGTSGEFAHDIVITTPVFLANLDCFDVSALLRMFDGCIAPRVLDALFIPCQLYDFAVAYESKSPYDVDSQYVWKNPIYSARLFDNEVRTFAGPSLRKLRQSDWGSDNTTFFGLVCQIFEKPGLKTLVPQCTHDRLTSGGGMVQLFWPFHERRQVDVYYCMVNIHRDVKCFQSLVHNGNYAVFDHPGCQAIIKHILGEASTLIYFNLGINALLVINWLGYSLALREQDANANLTKWYARCLMFIYIFRCCELTLQFLGAYTFNMLPELATHSVFWWHVFQTLASIFLLLFLITSTDDLGDWTKTACATIICLQWWEALLSLRIIKVLGEGIMPIVSTVLQVDVLSFIVIQLFVTFGMSHALYTLGVHKLGNVALMTYRLGVLGDFDLNELDGTETAYENAENSNIWEPFEYGATYSDRFFVRAFVIVVSLLSTVLLMNVLIAVLSKSFEYQHRQRTRFYWKTAGIIALDFSQQWAGFRHGVRSVCGKTFGTILRMEQPFSACEPEVLTLYVEQKREAKEIIRQKWECLETETGACKRCWTFTIFGADGSRLGHLSRKLWKSWDDVILDQSDLLDDELEQLRAKPKLWPLQLKFSLKGETLILEHQERADAIRKIISFQQYLERKTGTSKDRWIRTLWSRDGNQIKGLSQKPQQWWDSLVSGEDDSVIARHLNEIQNERELWPLRLAFAFEDDEKRLWFSTPRMSEDDTSLENMMKKMEEKMEQQMKTILEELQVLKDQRLRGHIDLTKM